MLYADETFALFEVAHRRNVGERDKVVPPLFDQLLSRSVPMPPPTVSPSAAAGTAGRTPAAVIHSLYRSVLREANKLDKQPVTKTLLPMPKKLQEAAGLTAQLHMPAGISFVAVSRKLFRSPNSLPLKAGFDALQTLRLHLTTVNDEMPRITRDHKELMTILDSAEIDNSRYWARPVPMPQDAPSLLKVPAPQGDAMPLGEVTMSTAAKAALLRRAGFDLKVGTALAAHPLSSAHADRRVMMVVEKTPATTTALVLDMLYSYPLSHGNPMFPEVLWGHEVHNGGYCHVDFTMPPTANVSVLHCLDPPRPETPSYSRWLQWAKGRSGAGGSTKTDPELIRQEHEACCKLVIKGENGGPNLYYSKVEALPYLSTLAQGQPRDALRVYWGCMKWSTPQLVTEIGAGHWMPVELSPSFFGAYTVQMPPPADAKPEDRAVSPLPIERFPMEDDLRDARQQRERHLGANITPPQVFPPTQPMCRREALWDQIMHTLGGDYRHLVGCVNPFTSSRGGEYSRVPPIAGGTGIAGLPVEELIGVEPMMDGGEIEMEIDENDLDTTELSLAAVGMALRRAAAEARARSEAENATTEDEPSPPVEPEVKPSDSKEPGTKKGGDEKKKKKGSSKDKTKGTKRDENDEDDS
jgi:hypothetical protein